MKNSVANRSNAQASCAASFIRANVAEGFKGHWVHLDIARNAYTGERGTGFGVGLVAAWLGGL